MKLAFFFCGALLWGQSVNQPQMGAMLDQSGNARAVFGVSGSVTLGAPILGGVLTSACSDWCIFKTAGAVVVAGVPVEAPAGGAIFAIDGAAAAVYFPATRQCALWRNGQLNPVDVRIDGEVVGLRLTAGAMQFAVRRRAATWIVDQNGSIAGVISAAAGPVMLLAGAVLYTDGDQVVLRRADASELRFDAPGAQSISALGVNYVQIRARGFSYALRIDAGHERIFQLPEPAE